VDNKSVIELTKNPVHHERSKHIDVDFHFIREHVKNDDVEMTHVTSGKYIHQITTGRTLQQVQEVAQNAS
jgi:hypothetical protein